MKLYDCKTAPSPRRVRIFAAEKGIELDNVQVDLAKGEQFGDEFRAINPDCVVPVLELDDGTHITEVLAICHYLEDIYSQPSLFGDTPEDRAKVLAWFVKIEQQGLMTMRDAFRNSAKGLQGHALTGSIGYKQIPELAERSRQCVVSFFECLDRQLDGNVYIAGANFSVADITAMVLTDFAAWIKIELPEDAGNLKRWYATVAARPSAKA